MPIYGRDTVHNVDVGPFVSAEDAAAFVNTAPGRLQIHEGDSLQAIAFHEWIIRGYRRKLMAGSRVEHARRAGMPGVDG